MPLFSLCVCAWVIGMVACDNDYAIVGICLGGAALVTRRRSLCLMAGFLAAGMLRMIWAQHATPAPPTMPDWYCVTNVQSSWQAQHVLAANQQHAGIQFDVPVTQTIHYADCVYVDGALQPIRSAHTAYIDQLHRRHITHRATNVRIVAVHQRDSWYRTLEWWRLASTQRIQQWIREPTATIMAGMLLGVSGDVTQQVSDAFKQSGTTHMLVISGWNISIVAWLCVAMSQRAAHYPVGRALFIITCITVYVLAAGASAAVVRAGIMGCIAVIGRTSQRPRDALNLIAIATLLMSGYDVSILWDLGFQLSTLATMGLVLFGDTVDGWISRTPLAHASLGWMRESMTATVAAQITTWPIMLCRLGMPSPWSLLANIIVSPVVPYAMAIGSIVLCCVWVTPAIMPFVHWIVYPAFLWIIHGSVAMAALPAPPPIAIDSLWIECCGHALWVGFVLYRTRHQFRATLDIVESGIVS